MDCTSRLAPARCSATCDRSYFDGWRGPPIRTSTLNQFVRFVEAYGLRSMLFELLVVNPKLLELLVKTFDASRYAGDLLIRRPQLLEEITRAGMLDREVSVARAS